MVQSLIFLILAHNAVKNLIFVYKKNEYRSETQPYFYQMVKTEVSFFYCELISKRDTIPPSVTDTSRLITIAQTQPPNPKGALIAIQKAHHEVLDTYWPLEQISLS